MKKPCSITTNISGISKPGWLQIAVVAACLFAGLTSTALSQELTPEDQALFGKAQSLNNLNHYAEAAGLLDGLHRRYSQEQNVSRESLKAFGFSNDLARAQKLFQELKQQGKADNECDQLFASILEANQQFTQAKELYLKLLANDSSNEAYQRKIAELAFWSKDYATALDFYQQLVQIHPDDIQLRTQLADILYSQGKKEAAEKEFSRLAQLAPEEQQIRIKQIEILAGRKQYDEALSLCREILTREPKNKDAGIWQARILSWSKRYAESLQAYDALIAGNPEQVESRREKARVLGWMRRYRDSIQEYKVCLDQAKENTAVLAEMQAKDAFYKRFDQKAVRLYRRWLELEPDNPEALCDLGQVYSWQGQWQNAKEVYQKILQLMPDHFQARQALAKVDLLSRRPAVAEEFEYYQADSSARDTDVKYHRVATAVTVPLQEQLALEFAEDTFIYDFPDTLSKVNREKITAAVQYRYSPSICFKAGYQPSAYSDSLGTSQNFFEQVNWQAMDAVLVKVEHRREDVIDNVQTLSDGLWKDRFGIRAEVKPNRRLTLGADYGFSDYKDGNHKNDFGLDLATLLTYEPRRLSLIYRFEQYGYQDRAATYFSPHSFHTNLFGWEWQHYLNKEELFWGAKDTYYTLRYLVNCDVGNQRAHQLYADINHDFNDRFRLSVTAARKIYEHESIYAEERVTLNAQYRF